MGLDRIAERHDYAGKAPISISQVAYRYFNLCG
jgi:hypothetical protein